MQLLAIYFYVFRSKFSSLLNHKNGRQDRSFNNEDVYQLEDYLEHRRNNQGYHHQFQRMPKQYGFGENRRNLPIEPIEPMPTFDIREEQFLEKKTSFICNSKWLCF